MKLHKVTRYCEVALKLFAYSLALLIGAATILSFCFYKLIIYAVIRIREGAAFHSMMDGWETAWSIQDNPSRSIITMLLFLHHDNPADVSIKMLNDQLSSSVCQKLHLKRSYFMGYYYFTKAPVTPKCTKMDNYETMDDLKAILNSISNDPMGTNDDELYAVKVGTKAIDSKYPMIVRIHHSLADGLSLTVFVMSVLSKDGAGNLQRAYAKFAGLQRKCKKGNLLSKLLDPNLYFLPLVARKERTLLQGNKLSGEKILVWFAEEENLYIDKIKRIKERVAGATFGTIWFTAIGSSLRQHFVKISPKKMPKSVLANTILLPKMPKLDDLVKFRNGCVEEIELKNSLVAALIEIPFKGNILENLKAVNNESQRLSESLDAEVSKLLLKFLSPYVPVPITRKLRHIMDATFAISNMPGLDKFTMIHGGLVEDCIFWVPNYLNTGIGFSLFSYDNRIQLGMIVDKALIDSTEDAQEVVDNVFKHIDQLEYLLMLRGTK